MPCLRTILPRPANRPSSYTQAVAATARRAAGQRPDSPRSQMDCARDVARKSSWSDRPEDNSDSVEDLLDHKPLNLVGKTTLAAARRCYRPRRSLHRRRQRRDAHRRRHRNARAEHFRPQQSRCLETLGSWRSLRPSCAAAWNAARVAMSITRLAREKAARRAPA